MRENSRIIEKLAKNIKFRTKNISKVNEKVFKKVTGHQQKNKNPTRNKFSVMSRRDAIRQR